MKILYLLIVLTASVIYCCASERKSICQIGNMQVDYRVNPVGIDHSSPFFSWQVNDSRQGAKQTAWQISVATSPELLEEGKADLWDSGKKGSSQNKQIVYGGQPLKSSTRYFWRVQIWDKDGNPSGYSEPSFFETAYLNPSDWKGQWITSTEDTASLAAPYFRKVIEAKGKPVRATAYVAGLGYHELYVNNQKASNTFLEPGFTRFDRRTLYVTYDITRLITNGKNCLGVILGNGWYNVQTKAGWRYESAPWRKSPRLLMDIRLEYADGTVEFSSTNDSWKFAEGPIRFNSIYCGEEYDARMELGNWSSPEFDDSGWISALPTSSSGRFLSAQTQPSIKIIRTIKPVAMFPLGNGKFVFDMGQNFAGVVRLKVQGDQGTRVTMRFGEQLNPDHSLNLDKIANRLRVPKDGHQFQTAIYTLKGDGEETYIPHFSYFGYQYIEVTTEPAIVPNQINPEGLFLSTGLEEVGSFRCSNSLLNKLYSATLNSYRSNFYSIPTDCPHREKNGWTGDAHISCETGLWNFDGIQAYRKWLQDFRDEQRETGELPGIVPTSGWGYHWGNGPAWDSALPVIAWELYQYYGDISVLHDNFEAVKRYVDYLGTRTETGIQTIGLGDWVALTKTPVEITSTSYYYHDALTLSKMAGILGKTDDQKKYATLSEKIKKVFNETFLDTVTNHYRTQNQTQTALSCALYQGLVPEQAVAKTIADLIKQIEQKNFHPDFGLLGSKYVLNVLHSTGNDAIGFKMMNSTQYPGWGYWISQGATSLWENWDGSNSHNHIFLGDFTSWYFKALGGIQIDPEHPGFDRFVLNPSFLPELSFVECSYHSMNGKIVSDWKRERNQVIWNVVVPANSQASLHLPASMKLEMIREAKSGKVKVGGRIVILEAGNYTLTLSVSR